MLFPNVEHVISVGVAGAVPHFSSYERHVRLGDVVVSYPLKADQPSYLHCQKVSKSQTPGSYDYSTREWRSPDGPLIKSLQQLNSGFQTDSFIINTIEKYVKEAQHLLGDQDNLTFDRPGLKTDKLFMEDECGEKVFVQHPKPLNGKAPREGQCRIHYGVLAGGKFVPCDYHMRLEFADMHNVLCYDYGDCTQVLEATEDCQRASYIIIRGMGDYVDGRTESGLAAVRRLECCGIHETDSEASAAFSSSLLGRCRIKHIGIIPFLTYSLTTAHHVLTS